LDPATWQGTLKNEARGKQTLQNLLQYFPDVVNFLRERRKRDSSAVICAGCGATVNNPKCMCDVQISTKELQ
jgi:hypothetical protein